MVNWSDVTGAGTVRHGAVRHEYPAASSQRDVGRYTSQQGLQVAGKSVLCMSESKDGFGRGRAGTAGTAAHSTGMVVVTVVLAPKIGRSQTILGLVHLPHGNE